MLTFPTGQLVGLIWLMAYCTCSPFALARESHWAEFCLPRNDGRYLSEIRPERVNTEHLPFAKPLAGGPVKVLFIVPQSTARDVVEFWQRMDIDFAAVVIRSGDDIADDFPLTTAVKGQSTPEMERRLNRYLDGNFDVICLAGVVFDQLPEQARFKILRAVRNGTGLLGLFDRARSREPALNRSAESTDAVAILQGTAIAGLPYFKVNQGNSNIPQAMKKLMAPTPATFGEGRIAWLNYSAPHDINHWYAGDCFARPASPALGEVVSPELCDAAISISAKTLMWAAGREQLFRILPPIDEAAKISRENWPVTFSAKIISANPDSKGKHVQALLVRPDGMFRAETHVTVTTDTEQTIASFELPPAPPGPAFLWCILKNDKGEVYDWCVSSITVESSVRFQELKMEPEVVGCNEETVLDGHISGEIPAAAKIIVEAKDSYGRMFWRQEMPAAESFNCKVPMQTARGRHMKVETKLVSGAEILSCERNEVFLSRPLGHEFLNLIWGHPGIGVSNWQARGAGSDLHGRQLQRAGFNGGMLFNYGHNLEQKLDYLDAGAKALSRTDTSWMFYCSHVQLPHVRKFFDPEERKKAEAELTALAARARAYGPHIYNLGDENGLYNQAPKDLTDFELEAYREFLRRSYAGDIEALNQAWEVGYSDFDEVQVEPKQGESTIPRRYDLKTFWEWAYADCHHWMRDAIRKGDPDAQVGAEGSDGADLELTISKLDWWAPYQDRLTNAILRFWKPWTAYRGNWWGGYSAGTARTSDLGVDVLWHGLARGSVNSSMFFVAGASSEGMMAVDGGYADYSESWIPEMKEIGASVGPLVRASRPIDDGVAIYYSHLSNHASAFDHRFTDTHKTQELLLKYFDALGVNIKFMSDRMILAGELEAESTPLLLMCVPKAIPDAIPAALEKYVEKGGIVIADVAPDLRGEHLVETAPGRLLSLFGANSAGEPNPVKHPIVFKNAVIGGKQLSLAAGECVVDTSINAGAGIAAGKTGEVPILIWRKAGKGLAVLLNFDFYHAIPTAQDVNPTTTAAADFLLNLMLMADLEPEFKPPAGLPWETIRRFRHADATVVGLDGWRGKENRMIFATGEKVWIHPLRQDWAGDSKATVSLPPGASDAGLVAVLPDSKRIVKIHKPNHVRPGSVVQVKVQVMVNGEKRPNTLLRFDVLNPDGSYEEAHRAFAMTDAEGKASVDWSIALGTHGVRTLRAVELVSGTTATSRVKLK